MKVVSVVTDAAIIDHILRYLKDRGKEYPSKVRHATPAA